MNDTHAPMLGAVRSGDAPGESSWDRQDYQAHHIIRSRAGRRFVDVARRGLRRRENARLLAEQMAEAESAATEAFAIALDEARAALAEVLVVDYGCTGAMVGCQTCFDDETGAMVVELLDELPDELPDRYDALPPPSAVFGTLTLEEINEAGGFIVTFGKWYV